MNFRVGILGFLAALAVTARAEDPPYLKLLRTVQTSDEVMPGNSKEHPLSTVYNREAIVPPQCYTRTEGRYNPCYVCHQDSIKGRENVMNDKDLQRAYSFSELGQTNHWKNLFEDRTARVAGISDQSIADYIRRENYSELADRLRRVGFKGWIPDLKNLEEGAGAFDHEGFAKDGSGWVAFNYKPFPSTFWPCNGSTDDVMIRLAPKFRQDGAGRYSKDIYKANLAILEAGVKGVEVIGCASLNEQAVGRDLNGDGVLGAIKSIVRPGHFVGGATNVAVETFLYPAGAEFLHTVRYLSVDGDGGIGLSRRMKEVRYMKKWKAYGKSVYARRYQEEGFEKELGNLPGYQNVGHHGLDNGSGWSIQGFIEDRKGRLRVSTYEENFFCMGCHNSIGSTIDKTFSFPRKVDGGEGWKYIDLRGMPDAPIKGETEGEIATYLGRAGGGSEFRNNEEMNARWFKPDGQPDMKKIKGARDVYELIVPSVRRAVELNKAYWCIVQDQDYLFGRDAVVTPPSNVYQYIENEKTPTLPDSVVFDYNIILDWSSAR